MGYFGAHNHDQYSNLRLRDCICKTEVLIQTAHDIGLKGIAITNHESLSQSVKAMKYVEKAKKEGKISQDFKVAIGNEIYLVDETECEIAKGNNGILANGGKMVYPHFILIAKDLKGYRALSKLSTNAWENSFYSRGLERVPTYKTNFEKILKENKGHIFGSTACLGSEFAQLVLKYSKNYQDMETVEKIKEFINWNIEIFGKDNFFIEIQPSFNEEQIIVNKESINIAKHFGLDVIITTDTHYPRLEHKNIHSTYLKASDGDRETEDFYATTYLMTSEEMRKYFLYLDDETYNSFLNNTLKIYEQIEEYSLFRNTEVPKSRLVVDIKESIFKDYKQYKAIQYFINSTNKTDREWLQLIENGFIKLKQEFNEINISRINEELNTLIEISEKMNVNMSSYYVLTVDLIDTIWKTSLVGCGRGSVSSWYTCYLVGITTIDSIKYNIPHWRHLNTFRAGWPDIDIDSESSKRESILESTKQKYDHDKVLNVATFRRETLKASILTICRALGIESKDSRYISSLVNVETLEEAINNVKDNNCKMLIQELKKYEGLFEAVQMIEGLICGRGIHAAGVIILNHKYEDYIAAMQAPKHGTMTTQFDLKETEYQGAIKYDFLSISALDRIRKCFDILIKEGKIDKKETLRETFNSVLHPQVLEYESDEMWRLLYEGYVTNVFQFEGVVGEQALNKVKPQTITELIVTNSLMRLKPVDGHHPISRFIEHKNDINIWYEEMRNEALNEEEIEKMKKVLSYSYGVADCQESIVILANEVCNLTLPESDLIRKGIAKLDIEIQKETQQMYFKRCVENGISENLMNYVWNYCVRPQLGYAFSIPHTTAYSMIALQEMNLAYKYGYIYWQTACLSINAGFRGEENAGSTDYAAIGKAIGQFDKGVILTPDINLADLEFRALPEENKILYSLGAISGVNKETALQIMENRPYNSLQDFIDKCVETKIITKAKAINLIKGGCFDRINSNRIELMVQYIEYITEQKNKLTTANLNKLLEYNLIPNYLEEEVNFYLYKKETFNKNNIYNSITKTEHEYLVPESLLEFTENKILTEFSECINYNDEGNMLINNKMFDKWYKNKIIKLTDWLSSEDSVNAYNLFLKRQNWLKHCLGSKEKWEFEALSCYINKHEIDNIPLHNYFVVDNYEELSSEPIVVEKRITRNGNEICTYKTNVIAGTVIDKNKGKGSITLSTPNGVVDVKIGKERFIEYDRVLDIDKSWFDKGTSLVIIGYRRDNTFIPKTYKTSIYKHNIMRVNNYDSKNVNLLLNKLEQE